MPCISPWEAYPAIKAVYESTCGKMLCSLQMNLGYDLT